MFHTRAQKVFLLITCLAILLQSPPGLAALDLQQAQVERLDNGLTLVVLEDPGFPAVSVQMLYRTGGRDEQYGKTGLAHFLEHMAFRATDNFPDTDVVSRIYAAGGEWHGYTWIDQTTYFETVPVSELDTVLRIEADRMARLKIPANELEPERGAVLAEMHGYENDPASLLHDQLVFAAFTGHPYRNNVIGLESDIQKVQLEDIQDFYREHYHPANAVLAVVGDIQAEHVIKRVEALFGGFPKSLATPLPRTVEPVQRGLRRVTLDGPVQASLFEVAYQAPSARNEDFPAFLLLRELLAGSGGINFSQDSGLADVRENSLLDGVTGDLRSWYPVSAQTYLFFLAGSLEQGQSPESVEAALESRIARLRDEAVSPEALDKARTSLRRELVFDLQTTEDAAHQLAYFDGLGALEVLLGLDSALDLLGPADIQRVARAYFQPGQRTIGWYHPGPGSKAGMRGQERGLTYHTRAGQAANTVTPPASLPVLHQLSGGVPVILQRASASPTVTVQLLLPGESWESPNLLRSRYPEPGFSVLTDSALASELAQSLDTLQAELTNTRFAPPPGIETILDPESRLEAEIGKLFMAPPGAQKPAPRPLAVVVSGDFQADALLPALEQRFGDLSPGVRLPAGPAPGKQHEVYAWLEHPVAQARLGYAVAAPSLASVESVPWQALLYILSHGYEGRLGKEAISRRGLVYYIDSRYNSDDTGGWISLSIGVDPGKLGLMRDLLNVQLHGLISNPPSEAEVNEARNHFLGRRLTEHQDNRERSTALARQWIQHGRLPGEEESIGRIESLTREQVLAILPEFVNGTIVTVRHRDPQDSQP